ncbi:MAG: hypothetical protein ACE5KZ_08355 [Candidatus Scalinduaceae bacterium]
MLPLWSKYPHHVTDGWDSLAIFLEGYAFERQGRRPDYSHVAIDALIDCKKQNNGNLTTGIVNYVWQSFKDKLSNKSLNYQNNPLCPRGKEYSKRYKQSIKHCHTQQPSLIEMFLEKIMPQELTLTSYFQNRIIEDNESRPSYDLLKSVQGIGKKVSSFYLRDLTDMMDSITLEKLKDRQLLQPIDIWVERTVKILAESKNMKEDEIAKWIVDNSIPHINPERVNMGIWFFCSSIAGSEYRLNNALISLNNAQTLVNLFMNRIKNVCKDC